MIRLILDFYVFVLIANSILSFFPQFRFKEWALLIRKASDFTCKPIRKYMPEDVPFDFSPLLAIIAVQLIKMMW